MSKEQQTSSPESSSRQITEEYLQYFIHCIREGCKVVFVQESNMMGVEDPKGNYIVVQLKDKVTSNPSVVPSESEEDKSDE